LEPNWQPGGFGPTHACPAGQGPSVRQSPADDGLMGTTHKGAGPQCMKVQVLVDGPAHVPPQAPPHGLPQGIPPLAHVGAPMVVVVVLVVDVVVVTVILDVVVVVVVVVVAVEVVVLVVVELVVMVGAGVQSAVTSWSASVSSCAQVPVWTKQSPALAALVHAAVNLSMHFCSLMGSGGRSFA